MEKNRERLEYWPRSYEEINYRDVVDDWEADAEVKEGDGDIVKYFLMEDLLYGSVVVLGPDGLEIWGILGRVTAGGPWPGDPIQLRYNNDWYWAEYLRPF